MLCSHNTGAPLYFITGHVSITVHTLHVLSTTAPKDLIPDPESGAVEEGKQSEESIQTQCTHHAQMSSLN